MAQTASIASRENKLTKWRAAFGTWQQGGRRPRVLFVGTSKMMGAGAGVTDVFTSGAATKRKTAVLARMLTSMGFKAGDNNFVGSNQAPAPATYDPRISLGAGWSWSQTTIGRTFGGTPAQNTGGGAGNLSFSPVGTFDTIDIIYAQGSAVGSFTVSDGATLLETVNGSGTSRLVRKTIALSSRGSSKVINIARASGNVYISSVIAYDSQNLEIELLNAGYFGSRTIDWVDTQAFNPGSATAWEGYAPDLTFISLKANDLNTSVPIATSIANLQILITRAQASGDVVLVNESTGGGNYAVGAEEYRSSLINLANTNNCLFHDEAARVNFATNPTWFSDSIHEKDFAHADEARAFLPYILPHLMS